MEEDKPIRIASDGKAHTLKNARCNRDTLLALLLSQFLSGIVELSHFCPLPLLWSFHPNSLTLLERRNLKQHCRRERIKQEKHSTSIQLNFFFCTQKVIISQAEFTELFNASNG